MVRKFSSTYPGRMLLLTIFLTILVGAIVLSLPMCQKTPMNFIDVFFTSTSVTCVTGLTTVPYENFTFMGQFIIMLLMQIGGLGLMTMSLTIFSLFINIGLTTQLMAGQLLEIDNLKNLKKMFVFTFLFTATVELIGALCSFAIFIQEYEFKQALFYSFFHAIASFCNAGIAIFPGGMQVYAANSAMLLITALIMSMGGLGFITWHEIMHYIRSKITRSKRHRMSLHSKVVIYMTIILTLSASLIFFTLEADNTLTGLTMSQKIINAFFNGMAARSVGFITVNFNMLQLATILMIMVISFIGASPGSTGSGIKSTSFAIFLATVRSVLFAKKHIFMFNRSIAPVQIYKALTIITLSMSWIISITFFLLITEKAFSFLDIIFETTSAFVNLGLSAGITHKLSMIGKLFIILSMIFGRIGSLTLALAFIRGRDSKEFSYPEEKVILS